MKYSEEFEEEKKENKKAKHSLSRILLKNCNRWNKEAENNSFRRYNKKYGLISLQEVL